VSYYDFDNHFWCPHEVCMRSQPSETQSANISDMKQTGIDTLLVYWKKSIIALLVDRNR